MGSNGNYHNVIYKHEGIVWGGVAYMAVDSDGEILFDHLEQYLGSMTNRLSCKSEHDKSFEVFVFAKQPEPDCQCLVTFGLSAHHLHIGEQQNHIMRMELAICANFSFDAKVLSSLLFAVGLDALEHHTTPGLHRVLDGKGPVLRGGNPLYEHLYLASSGYFPHEFEICEKLSPPVVIAQLIPISSSERDFIAQYGWSAFEYAINEQDVDLLDFDNRREVTSKHEH